MQRSHAAIGMALALVAGLAWGVASARTDRFPANLFASDSDSEGDDSEESGPAGRWRTARGHESSGGGDAGDVLAVPYLSGTNPAPTSELVTRYDKERASDGFNLVISGHAPEAYLVDMSGGFLHKWSHEPKDVWPEETAKPSAERWRYWRRARVFPNGDLVGIYEGQGIVRIDKDSKLLWHHTGREHHDLDVDAEGNIHVLGRKVHTVDRINAEKRIVEDLVTVLSPKGDELDSFSLLECFENSVYRPLLDFMDDRGDIFHTNSIQLLDGTLSDRSPAFAKGNLLISLRHLHTIAVVDPKARKVVWALTGGWRQQHDPLLLPTGRMLLFDNNRWVGWSRVIEFDPFTQEVHWEYRGTEQDPFYSERCGAVQRLPNGNTLITESDFGRAFEVTSDNEIVWEYLNPFRAGDEMELIATLFDMVRLPPDFPADAFATGPK